MKSTIRQTVKSKARQVLAFARQQAHECKDPAEMFIVLFGPRGKATKLFPTDKAWSAFERTDEFTQIRKLFEALPVKTNHGS